MKTSVYLAATAVCLALASGASDAEAQQRLTAAHVVRIAEARSLPSSVTPAQRKVFRRAVAAFKRGDTANGKKLWGQFVQACASTNRQLDVRALGAAALHESHMANNQSLMRHAQKVAFYNQQMKAVRDHVASLRSIRKTAKRRRLQRVSIPVLRLSEAFRLNAPAVRSRSQTSVPPAQLEVMLQNWEGRQAEVGKNSELARMQLQSAMQKQQQLIQMISQIAKAMHDTAMASIQNMR